MLGLMSKKAEAPLAWISGDLIWVSSQYHPELVEQMRAIEGRKWHGAEKRNSFPIKKATQVAQVCRRWRIPLAADLNELAGETTDLFFQASKQLWNVELDGDKVSVCFDYNARIIQTLKFVVPALRWDGTGRRWTTKRENLPYVIEVARQYGLTVSDEIENALAQEMAQQADLIAASRALDAEVHIPGLVGELLPYQRAGVVYLQRVRKGILADQPGLGKTIQALATVATEHAFPAVVVCPNTLKFNWRSEINKFFPGLRVEVVSGTKEVEIPHADVIVINRSEERRVGKECRL